MKQGTKVHEELESQVHEVVQVDVQSKEDGWGLRIWNIIQGLRTLRATGLTRELEVWGLIDGQVVNGIIDELSFECPDQNLEDATNEAEIAAAAAQTPDNQMTIDEFFAKRGKSRNPWIDFDPMDDSVRKVYITDIKTRASKFLPALSSMRPTRMQLMLYRRLLLSLATNNVPRETVFARYQLDPVAPFSNMFVDAISSLDFNFVHDADLNEEAARFNGQEGSVFELQKHNSLTQLWDLMLREFAQTIPTAEALGSVLQVEFRSQANGEILGHRIFRYDQDIMESYVDDEMKWWRGEREARGVDIEDAFKCRLCEFAESCDWRMQKIEDAVATSRKRRKSVKKTDAA